MKIEALVSFCGTLSMAKGEIRDYSNEAVISDLLNAGYVKLIEEADGTAEAGTTEKKTKVTIRKAMRTGESK